MLELEQVKELVATMMTNDLSSLEVRGTNYSIRLVRARCATPRAASVTGSKLVAVYVRSPATGTYRSLDDDDGLAPPDCGSQVFAGDPLGYVEIGPVRLLCIAPAAGRLVGRLPSQGQAVNAGDIMFTLETIA